MKFQIHFIIAILILMTSCNNRRSDSPEEWSEEELSEWFTGGDWRHGFEVAPDDSLNQREMAIRYHRNPERWEKAFSYLAEHDLDNIDPGRYEVDGSDVFVTVTEYVPKPIEDAQFEAHRIYADIQYVASGQEQISMAPINAAVITEAYDEENDVMFLASPESSQRIATPDRFFVFFPSQAYRTSVRVNENDSSLVRKVVVKVKLN